MPGCLSTGEGNAGVRKGDFVLQTGHIIEIVTKLFLVVQNAVGRPPAVNIATEFEANFGQDVSVPFTFRLSPGGAAAGGSGGGGGGNQVKLVKRGNKFEVLV